MSKMRLYEKHMGELYIFEVVDSLVVNKRFVLNYKQPLYFVSYKNTNTDLHGDIEPIGLFNYAGTRKYIWRDEYYKESSNKIDMSKISKLVVSLKNKKYMSDLDSKVLKYLERLLLYSTMVNVIRKPILFSNGQKDPHSTTYVSGLHKIFVT